MRKPAEWVFKNAYITTRYKRGPEPRVVPSIAFHRSGKSAEVWGAEQNCKKPALKRQTLLQRRKSLCIAASKSFCEPLPFARQFGSRCGHGDRRGCNVVLQPASWPHDDWDISLVLMGRFGEQNAINFVNITLSWIFRLLCTLSTSINWFFWLRWLFSAMALWGDFVRGADHLPFPMALAADGVIKLVF